MIAGFLCVSAVFMLFIWFLGSSRTTTMIALPMLSIAGIALLLICLAAISYVFVRVNLQDRSQALGLPPGSIQSVIALSLIVLFAILSILVFTSTGDVAPRTLKGLTATERDDQIGKLGGSFAGWEPQADGKFTLYVRDPGIDARNDVGKQLIVLIGTLMTSAVSFYFGTRATVAGAQATSKPDADGAGDGGPGNGGDPPAAAPAITSVDPAAGIPRGSSTQVTIFGTGLGAATAVTIVKDGTALAVGAPKATDTGLTCDVTPAADAATGPYDVTVEIGDRRVVRSGGLMVG